MHPRADKTRISSIDIALRIKIWIWYMEILIWANPTSRYMIMLLKWSMILIINIQLFLELLMLTWEVQITTSCIGILYQFVVFSGGLFGTLVLTICSKPVLLSFHINEVVYLFQSFFKNNSPKSLRSFNFRKAKSENTGICTLINIPVRISAILSMVVHSKHACINKF